MALLDHLRTAWDNHKEDNEMLKRFSGEWQERPSDTEENTVRHLQRITQPAIDRYLSEHALEHLRNASPEQAEEVAGKIQKATGITETNARAAVELQQNDYRPSPIDSPQELDRASRQPAEAYSSPAVSTRVPEPEQDSTAREYKRLEQSVGAEHAQEFTWKQDSGDIKSYQHAATGNHVHFDSAGQFYNQEREPISREAAISHAVYVPAIEIVNPSVAVPGMNAAVPAQSTPTPERSQAATATTPELPFPVAQLPPNEQAISL